MYLNYDESIALAKKLADMPPVKKGIELAVFPSVLALVGAKEVLKDTSFAIGAQNCVWIPQGAYTGAVSALMFKEAGCKYVLVGHSERRYIFGESNDDVRKKLEAALDASLIPVLCVGETDEDRKEEKVKYRLKKQLMKALEGLKVKADNIIVAYEPVWAIGTGNPCQPADADDIQGWIKQEIKQYIDGDVSVLYGGSVDSENVLSYVSREMIDGLLVGGASAKIDSFSAIIKAAQNKS